MLYYCWCRFFWSQVVHVDLLFIFCLFTFHRCLNFVNHQQIRHGKNRAYLLQMSNYTVYFNAKRRFWARASKRSTTRSMSICCTMCPSRSTLQTTNLCAFENSRGHVPQCPMPGDATGCLGSGHSSRTIHQTFVPSHARSPGMYHGRFPSVHLPPWTITPINCWRSHLRNKIVF